MDFLTDILKIILDSSYRITHKLTLFIGIFLLIALLDNHLGLSNNWTTKNKIDQIEKIEKIVNNPLTNKAIADKLRLLEFEIYEQENLANYLFDALSSTTSFITLQTTTNNEKNNAKPIYYPIYLHVITSSFWFILFHVITMIMLFTSKNKITKEVSQGILYFTIMTIIISALMSYVFYLLPRYNNPIFNYILNLTISFIIVSIKTILILLLIISGLKEEQRESHKKIKEMINLFKPN